MSLSSATLTAVKEAKLDPDYVEALAKLTLAEDLGGPDGVDITSTATIDAHTAASGTLVARAAGVIAGLPLAAALFDVAAHHQKTSIRFTPHVEDGTAVVAGTPLATVEGSSRSILTAERSALNLLCRASGVATHTFLWAKALAGTGTQVLDTRKTTPGLRAVDKYAVRCGGGANKRFGLFDTAMIKDNHVVAAGSLTAAYKRVRSEYPDAPVEVEVRTFEEVDEALAAGANYLLCDNMSAEKLHEVVIAVRKAAGNAVTLEATGGLTLENAKEYAETGVDFLSVGGLTHSSPIVDIALDLK